MCTDLLVAMAASFSLSLSLSLSMASYRLSSLLNQNHHLLDCLDCNERDKRSSLVSECIEVSRWVS